MILIQFIIFSNESRCSMYGNRGSLVLHKTNGDSVVAQDELNLSQAGDDGDAAKRWWQGL